MLDGRQLTTHAAATVVVFCPNQKSRSVAVEMLNELRRGTRIYVDDTVGLWRVYSATVGERRRIRELLQAAAEEVQCQQEKTEQP